MAKITVLDFSQNIGNGISISSYDEVKVSLPNTFNALGNGISIPSYDEVTTSFPNRFYGIYEESNCRE